ncbi:hypothetical protein D3C73_1127080 [compost metagenome]
MHAVRKLGNTVKVLLNLSADMMRINRCFQFTVNIDLHFTERRPLRPDQLHTSALEGILDKVTVISCPLHIVLKIPAKVEGQLQRTVRLIGKVGFAQDNLVARQRVISTRIQQAAAAGNPFEHPRLLQQKHIHICLHRDVLVKAGGYRVNQVRHLDLQHIKQHVGPALLHRF